MPPCVLSSGSSINFAQELVMLKRRRQDISSSSAGVPVPDPAAEGLDPALDTCFDPDPEFQAAAFSRSRVTVLVLTVKRREHLAEGTLAHLRERGFIPNLIFGVDIKQQPDCKREYIVWQSYATTVFPYVRRLGLRGEDVVFFAEDTLRLSDGITYQRIYEIACQSVFLAIAFNGSKNGAPVFASKLWSATVSVVSALEKVQKQDSPRHFDLWLFQSLDIDYVSNSLGGWTEHSSDCRALSESEGGWRTSWMPTLPASAVTVVPRVGKLLDALGANRALGYLAALKSRRHALSDFPCTARSCKPLVLQAVQIDGRELKHASEALRKDVDVVMAAVRQQPEALVYASTALKENVEVMKAALASGNSTCLVATYTNLVNRVPSLADDPVIAALVDFERAGQHGHLMPRLQKRSAKPRRPRKA